MNNDNILAFTNSTPDALIQSIAKRFRQRRLEVKLDAKTIGGKISIPLATYRRFESLEKYLFGDW